MSAIDALAAELARLPGIGRKTALRLTYHLLRQPPEQSRRLADALVQLGERVRPCTECFNLTEDVRCSICSDPRRDASVICVVEEASDIGAIERSAEFRGLYHVLGGRLSPLDGVGPDSLNVTPLIDRVLGTQAAPETGSMHGAATGVREVIIATNPSLEGEATALFVQRQIAAAVAERGAGAREAANGSAVVVSRIARGIPVGGDLEYADGVTIAQALAARRGM